MELQKSDALISTSPGRRLSISNDKVDILVEAQLNKGTFLAGETLSCKLTLWSQPTSRKTENSTKFRTSFREWQTPPPTPITPSLHEKSLTKGESTDSTTKISPRGKKPLIDLISVQVLGYYMVEPTYVKVPPPKPTQTKQWLNIAPSVFSGPKGENKHLLFATPAQVVACEVDLLPVGTTRSYLYQMVLPLDLPPTCKLNGLKCCYTLIISAQQGRNPPKSISFPLRVLTPSCALRKMSFTSEQIFKANTAMSSAEVESSQGLESFAEEWPLLKKKNKFYVHEEHENLLRETLISVQNILEEHSKYVTMDITSEQQHLVKFSINKTSFLLGDSIRGFFDFTDAEVTCYQLSIRLETDQVIESHYGNPARSNKPIKTVIAEHHEFTRNTVQTNFQFSIPVEANQEFTTDIVSLHWFLQFEFIIASKRTVKEGVPVEPLHWSLPIRVLVSSHPQEQIYKSRNMAVLFTSRITQ